MKAFCHQKGTSHIFPIVKELHLRSSDDGINKFVVLTVDNGIEEFTFDDGIEKFAVDGINEFVVVTVDNGIKEYAAVAVDDGIEGFAKYFAKNFSPTCYVE